MPPYRRPQAAGNQRARSPPQYNILTLESRIKTDSGSVSVFFERVPFRSDAGGVEFNVVVRIAQFSSEEAVSTFRKLPQIGAEKALYGSRSGLVSSDMQEKCHAWSPA